MAATVEFISIDDCFLKVRFLKMVFFIKLVVSLTIVKDNPSLTIFNNDPLLTIVNIFVNFFKNERFLRSDRFKKTIG